MSRTYTPELPPDVLDYLDEYVGHFRDGFNRYTEPLLRKVQAGEIDPSFVITHRLKIEDCPCAYKTFRDKQDGCIKVVLNP